MKYKMKYKKHSCKEMFFLLNLQIFIIIYYVLILNKFIVSIVEKIYNIKT